MSFAREPAHDPLYDRLDRAVEAVQVATAELLEAIADVAEVEEVDDPNLPDLGSHLSARYRVKSETAREWIRVGVALRGLPAIREAFAAGSLSWDQVRILTRFVEPEEDAEWGERAQEMRPHRLYLEQLRRQKERERAEETPDHALRYLRTSWDEEKRFLYLEASLAAEQGAVVEAALKGAAEQVGPAEEEARDRRGARYADALESLVTGAGGASGGGSRAAGKPTIVVHVDERTLAGQEGGLAETASGLQLSPQAVERLFCEARIRWVKERDGAPVGIGWSSGVSEAVEELIRFRDRRCRHPGCDRDWAVHVHHIFPRSRGGPHTPENLILLCGSHHRALHAGGWATRGDPAGRLVFANRRGDVLGTSDPAGTVARARRDPVAAGV